MGGGGRVGEREKGGGAKEFYAIEEAGGEVDGFSPSPPPTPGGVAEKTVLEDFHPGERPGNMILPRRVCKTGGRAVPTKRTTRRPTPVQGRRGSRQARRSCARGWRRARAVHLRRRDGESFSYPACLAHFRPAGGFCLLPPAIRVVVFARPPEEGGLGPRPNRGGRRPHSLGVTEPRGRGGGENNNRRGGTGGAGGLGGRGGGGGGRGGGGGGRRTENGGRAYGGGGGGGGVGEWGVGGGGACGSRIAGPIAWSRVCRGWGCGGGGRGVCRFAGGRRLPRPRAVPAHPRAGVFPPTSCGGGAWVGGQGGAVGGGGGPEGGEQRFSGAGVGRPTFPRRVYKGGGWEGGRGGGA